MSIQTKTDRKCVYDQCVTYKTSQACLDEQASKKQAIINNMWQSIINWTNVTEPTSPLASQTSLSLPIISALDQTTLDSWTSQLTTAGYTVAIQNNRFTISQ